LIQSVVYMSLKDMNKGYLSPHDSCSRQAGHQFGHAQQIIGRSNKPSRQLRPLDPLESCPPEPPNHLNPTKNFLHLLSKPLAQTIPNMTRRSTINRRSTSAPDILRHMRGNLPAAQHAYKPSFVVPLVTPKGLGLNPFPGLPLEHRLGSLRLRRPRRPSRTFWKRCPSEPGVPWKGEPSISGAGNMKSKGLAALRCRSFSSTPISRRTPNGTGP